MFTDVYKYKSFSRKYSFTIQLHADSLDELKFNYWKVNYIKNALIPYVIQDPASAIRKIPPVVEIKLGDVICNAAGGGLMGIMESVDVGFDGGDGISWETFEPGYKVPRYIELTTGFTVLDNFNGTEKIFKTIGFGYSLDGSHRVLANEKDHPQLAYAGNPTSNTPNIG